MKSGGILFLCGAAALGLRRRSHFSETRHLAPDVTVFRFR